MQDFDDLRALLAAAAVLPRSVTTLQSLVNSWLAVGRPRSHRRADGAGHDRPRPGRPRAPPGLARLWVGL